eukprot:365447-Chlamydomonas_euryale.AAC.18
MYARAWAGVRGQACMDVRMGRRMGGHAWTGAWTDMHGRVHGRACAHHGSATWQLGRGRPSTAELASSCLQCACSPDCRQIPRRRHGAAAAGMVADAARCVCAADLRSRAKPEADYVSSLKRTSPEADYAPSLKWTLPEACVKRA